MARRSTSAVIVRHRAMDSSVFSIALDFLIDIVFLRDFDWDIFCCCLCYYFYIFLFLFGMIAINWFQSVTEEARTDEYGKNKVYECLGVPHVRVEDVKIFEVCFGWHFV